MFRAAFAFVLASAIAAQAEDRWSGGYYCKALASGGVEYDETSNQWKGTVIGVSEVAFLISVKSTGDVLKTPQGETPTYLIRIKQFGEQGEAPLCSPGGSNLHVPISPNGSASCLTKFFYMFDLSSLRLQVTFNGGFLDNSGTNFEPAFIAVAKCDKVA